MAIALFGVIACEQEAQVSKQEISQPQNMIPVSTEHTATLDAFMEFDNMLRNPIFAQMGFQKDESTGGYTVDTLMFAHAMSDGSLSDHFFTEGFDDIIKNNPDFLRFQQYIEANMPAELEEAGMDLRGKRWYCCTICCPGLAYKGSKKRRKWGARIWCTVRQIGHSAIAVNWCGQSLKERHCTSDDGCD